MLRHGVLGGNLPSDKSNLKVLVFVHHWKTPHKTKIPYGAIKAPIEVKEIIFIYEAKTYEH